MPRQRPTKDEALANAATIKGAALDMEEARRVVKSVDRRDISEKARYAMNEVRKAEEEGNTTRYTEMRAYHRDLLLALDDNAYDTAPNINALKQVRPAVLDEVH